MDLPSSRQSVVFCIVVTTNGYALIQATFPGCRAADCTCESLGLIGLQIGRHCGNKNGVRVLKWSLKFMRTVVQ